MLQIEQAVFTWTGNERAAGYEVTARSGGVVEDDARELAAWGPTHDSMHDSSEDAESYNFHPLPSGAYCISRTRPLGWHGGVRTVHTHCLIVSPQVLARFGNNPFALIQAATTEGLWQERPTNEPRLTPLELTTSGAAPVDQPLLAFLAADPGPENVAALVQAARDAVCLALGCPASTPLIAGLFSCLPPECRTEFPFSTGLKFSPRRPFRIVTLSDDPAERRWIADYPNVAALELRRGETPPPMAIDGWTRLVRQALLAGRVPFLAAQISKRHSPWTLDDLPALGLQWLEDMEALDSDDLVETGASAWFGERTDGAHRKFAKNAGGSPSASIPSASASSHLHPESAEVREKLECLDDLVYDALNGHAAAFEQLRMTWPKVAAELGQPLLAESQEQYLRYALSIWEQCVQPDGVRQPSRAIAALDVLCLLFGEAE